MLFSQRLTFNYANRNCTEFGIVNASTSGLSDETFITNRTIKETKVRGRKTPYFSEIEQDPFEFQLKLYFEEKFTEEKLHKVREWLITSFYQPFYFDEYPELIYYCTPTSSSRLAHNSLYEGYAIITMRCDSPFAYSPVYVSPTYVVEGSKEIELMNYGTEQLQPELWIKQVNLGDVQIENYSMSQSSFVLSNVQVGETVYINNESKDIESDIAGNYHYDNFNDNFLTLTTGNNRLEVFGDCEIVFRYQYKYALG